MAAAAGSSHSAPDVKPRFAIRALEERLKGHETPSWTSCLPSQARISRAGLQACTAAHEHGFGWKQPRQALNLTVFGQVWELSQDPAGCREVQSVLDTCKDETLLVHLAQELRGHVLEAMRCPHANHVMQKLIGRVAPEHLQFVVDELMAFPGAADLAARHKYGCRIVQRLLECCPAAQLRPLAEALLADAAATAQHPYGNYVVQKLIEYGTAEQRHRLSVELGKDTATLCTNMFSCAVVKFALSSFNKQDALALSRAIVQEPGLLAFLARDKRHGHAAVCMVLEALPASELRRAQQLLGGEAELLARGVRQRRKAVRPVVKNLKLADCLAGEFPPAQQCMAYKAGA